MRRQILVPAHASCLAGWGVLRTFRANFPSGFEGSPPPRPPPGCLRPFPPLTTGCPARRLTEPGAPCGPRDGCSRASSATRGRLSRRAKGFLRATIVAPPLPPELGKERRGSPAASAARRGVGSGSAEGTEAPRFRDLFRRSRTISGGLLKLGE